MTTDASGGNARRQTYYAYGPVRTTEGTLPTDYTFTGQKLDERAALMYYGARYYDPAIGRFIQPDSLIPDPYNPQSLNRYSYVHNNPVRYTDPTGHKADCGDDCGDDDDDRIVPEPPAQTKGPDLNEQPSDAGGAGGGGGGGGEVVLVTAAGQVITIWDKAGTWVGGVYQVVENGVVRYYGITNDYVRRGAEHLRDKGWTIEPIPGLNNLSKFEARAVEQVLIEQAGLPNLYNKINSIAQSNPMYQQAISKGTEILTGIGMLPTR